jgi:hypothetical protein
MAAMGKAIPRVVRWLVLGLGALAAWQVGSYFWGQRTGPEKLINQLWIERMPTSQRDMVWHLVAIEHDGHQVGALVRASRWRAFSDGFLWKQQGDQFEFVTPQNGCRSSVKARTWKCAGEAPKPFELCLELEGHGQRYRYYSRNDWEIRPGHGLDAELAFAAPALQAALNLPGEASAETAEAVPGAECTALGPVAPRP